MKENNNFAIKMQSFFIYDIINIIIVGENMFKGDYNFFEYKYNIAGYTGQDFGGFAQYLYLAISMLLMIILLVILKNKSKRTVLNIIKVSAIFLLIFYIGKTTWESIYDINYSGEFNINLLPFDACSIIMLATLLAGFGKGKIKGYAECWLVTGGLLGGISAMVILNAFNYYPFWSFGALYSMLWHFLMVFIGFLLVVTNYVEINYKTLLKGFAFHLIFSLIVILLDFIKNLDFMMYLNLGGIPFFESIATKITSIGMQFLNPLLMIVLYFIGFNLVYLITLCIKKIIRIN